MTLTELTLFFGWMSAINIGLLFFSLIMILALKDKIKPLHAKLFNLQPEYLDRVYFKFLAYYKLGIILFNLVPYLTLRLCM